MFTQKILLKQKLKFNSNETCYLYECSNVFDGLFYMFEIVKDNNTVINIKSSDDKAKMEKVFFNTVSLDNKKYLFNNGFIK